MATRRTIAIALTAAAWPIALTGCSEGGGYSGGSTASEEALVVDDIDIPTQAEEDAIAEATITAENADAAFEELAREIEADQP